LETEKRVIHEMFFSLSLLLHVEFNKQKVVSFYQSFSLLHFATLSLIGLKSK